MLKQWIERIIRDREHRRAMRSLNEKRAPKLSCFTRSAAAYAQQHAEAMEILNAKMPQTPHAASLAYRDRVNAQWGLIARGADALPYAMEMLKSKCADAREDAAGILGEVGADDGVVRALLLQLDAETDTVARDTIIESLGGLKNRAAIGPLAAIIRDDDADGDTQWSAISSLGRIVRKRFLKRDDPLAAAREWLDTKWTP